MLSFFQQHFPDLYDSFEKTFVTDNRGLQLLKGLGITLEITLFATLLGIILGVVIAIIRSTHDNNLQGKKCRTLWDCILKFLNGVCNVYITVIRGTPVVIQLMIIYYVILASMDDGTVAAIIAFGINSGAYVAEIVRSGIMSIDKGQFEAGRSLGLNYPQTMISIILPQAFKNILPPSVMSSSFCLRKPLFRVTLLFVTSPTSVTLSVQEPMKPCSRCLPLRLSIL